MQESDNTSIKIFFSKCLKEAQETKCCLTCLFSRIKEETGFGYCVYNEGIFVSLKPIEELDCCHHWTPQKSENEPDGYGGL